MTPEDLMQFVQPGDVVCCRHPDQFGHTIGPKTLYYDHMAVVGDGVVIEAQKDQGGVIACPWSDFFLSERYPKIIVRRPKGWSKTKAEDAAKIAASFVGDPYWIRSSMKRRINPSRGFNCVAVVRAAWRGPFGVDPRWEWPDDGAADERWETVAEGVA